MDVDAGVASLRQAVVHGRFFAGQSPVPDLVRPLFHGLGGEITRGFYYPATVLGPGSTIARARRALRLRIQPGLRLRRPPEAALDVVIDALDREVRPLRPTLEQWLDLYYWQVRCLRWGADLMVGGDTLQWHWTPLLDREAVLDAWQLPVEEKATSRWIERVTERLAPALADVPYGKRLSPLRRTGVGLSRRALRSLGLAYPEGALRLVRRRIPPADASALRPLWRSVFAPGADAVWPELISRRHLDTLIDVDPGGDACWALATVELAFKVAP
jgi:hypothetical protein